ncbi:MAG: hypothetical protein PF636_11535 [Actinomycetota bacterium]|nr:hypothetical protein [Actinomycetota bacterium]
MEIAHIRQDAGLSSVTPPFDLNKPNQRDKYHVNEAVRWISEQWDSISSTGGGGLDAYTLNTRSWWNKASLGTDGVETMTTNRAIPANCGRSILAHRFDAAGDSSALNGCDCRLHVYVPSTDGAAYTELMARPYYYPTASQMSVYLNTTKVMSPPWSLGKNQWDLYDVRCVESGGSYTSEFYLNNVLVATNAATIGSVPATAPLPFSGAGLAWTQYVYTKRGISTATTETWVDFFASGSPTLTLDDTDTDTVVTSVGSVQSGQVVDQYYPSPAYALAESTSVTVEPLDPFFVDDVDELSMRNFEAWLNHAEQRIRSDAYA